MDTAACPMCDGEDLEEYRDYSVCAYCNIGFTADELWEEEVEGLRDKDIAHMNNLLYSQYDDDDPTLSDEELHEARLKRAA